ncbi:hypothetical protein BC629DRAFT_575883 [Irpex lacteus]|nr:hypothetical protein BC629DRAFT_575883 [Irpex lacteus]
MYSTWATMRAETMFGVYLNLAFGFNIFVDLSIAAILTLYLNAKGRSVACGDGTKKILLKLVYYAMTAGALTVVVNIAVLISYNKSMHTLTYAGLLQIIAKLNANSMLAMLNARKTIAGATITAAGMPVELSRLSSRRPAQPSASIHVFQETIVIEEKWDASGEDQKSKPPIQDTASQMSSYRGAETSV